MSQRHISRKTRTIYLNSLQAQRSIPFILAMPTLYIRIEAAVGYAPPQHPTKDLLPRTILKSAGAAFPIRGDFPSGQGAN